MSENEIRVLHALGTMDPGGVETWLLRVLRHIDRERFRFDFCTFGERAGLYAAEAKKFGAKVLKCGVNADRLTFGWRFRRILREGRYDVVHSHVHLFSGAILRWAKAEHVPIRIAHGHTDCDDRPSSLFRSAYVRIMRSWIDQYATDGFGASREAAAALFGEDWEADGRFSLIHYGVDLRDFQRPIVRREIRAQFGIPDDALVVGHVGRFVEAKNHRFLLQIGREILNRRPHIHFLLVGDGPLRCEVEASARAMGFDGHIHFAGARTDVPTLLRGGMDVFIFPSRHEGFGLALLEAQAAGLPCVAADTIPKEAIVSTESLQVLPLSSGPTRWAANVINTFESRSAHKPAAQSRSAATVMPVEDSVQRVSAVYARDGQRWSAGAHG